MQFAKLRKIKGYQYTRASESGQQRSAQAAYLLFSRINRNTKKEKVTHDPSYTRATPECELQPPLASLLVAS